MLIVNKWRHYVQNYNFHLSCFHLSLFQIQLNKEGIHPKQNEMMGRFNSNRDRFLVYGTPDAPRIWYVHSSIDTTTKYLSS